VPAALPVRAVLQLLDRVLALPAQQLGQLPAPLPALGMALLELERPRIRLPPPAERK